MQPVLLEPSLEASLIDCACSRSNVAAIGNASASAGSGRWTATSTSHADHPGSSASADVIPPDGNQRVVAAMNTRSRDVSNGGTERQTSEMPRSSAAAAPRRLPVKMPNGMPRAVAAMSATTARAAVFAVARPIRLRTGRL